MNAAACTILIPARLASTRLPEKPLADICGAPMIVRVAQRVQRAQGGNTQRVQIVVAADHARIVDACAAHGVQAVLTDAHHPSGSDRLAQACCLLGLADDAIVVNVQGDEPLMDPALPDAVAQLLQATPSASMSTAAHPIADWADMASPHVVKVVCDAQQMALYFSRAPIPWWRDGYGAASSHGVPAALSAQPAPLRHIGIYAYRVGFLKQFPQLPAAPIETCESLEQLRALWHGHRIAVHVTPHAPGPGVDTPEDLEKVRALYRMAQPHPQP